MGCELVKTAFEDVLAKMGIPIASAADVWTIIARLALDDEEVGALLATVGELLALPPGQTIVGTILGALVNNRSKPNVQQRLQDLLILLTRKEESYAGLFLGSRALRVRTILVALVDNLSKPNVQRKLQELFILTRTEEWYAGLFYGSRKLFADGSDAMAAGRCKLLLTEFEDVLAKMDVPIASAADVWTIIARFALDDEEVGASLATVRELLALPPVQ